LPLAMTNDLAGHGDGNGIESSARARNTFDLHVHAAPDVVPRKTHDLELARAAKAAGMRGLLLKSHHFSTVERAFAMGEVATGLAVFGGLALNGTIGGFNVEAVDVALRLGARCIWMPTISARHHWATLQGVEGGITVLDETASRVRSTVAEIIELIAERDAILATGHLSPNETELVVHAARRQGVQRILVQHAESVLGVLPLDLQKKLAKGGCVIEHCAVATTRAGGSFPLDVIVQGITAVGPGACVISTDLGQLENAHPVEGMSTFLEALSASGVSEAGLVQMSVENPVNLCLN
jgi:hypothetical protein